MYELTFEFGLNIVFYYIELVIKRISLHILSFCFGPFIQISANQCKNKTKQKNKDKTKQNKTKQNKNKTKQNKAKQVFLFSFYPFFKSN